MSQIKKFYEEFNSTLVKDRIRPNLRIKRILKFIDNIFASYLSQTKNLRILDIGCGIGILSERLASYEKTKVDAIDISENNVGFAKKTVKNVNFICGDFLTTDFSANYDFICLFDCLEHFPKSKHWDVFTKIKNLSSNNAVVAITTPNGQFIDAYSEVYDNLQIVDESIYFSDILQYASVFGFELIKYKLYDVDYNNQYQYFLLRKKQESFQLKKIERKESIQRKIWNKLCAIYKSWKYKGLMKRNYAIGQAV